MSIERLAHALILVAVSACGSEPVDVACVLPDGRTLGAGESADDPCLVCSPRSGALAPSWTAGCVETTRHSVDWRPFRVFYMELGPDADGGGMGDIVLGGFNEARKSIIAVVSVETGEVIFSYEDEQTDLEMGRGHRYMALGPDVDGDGLADLALSSANSWSDDDSSDFPMYVPEGFPNPGRVDIWAPASGDLIQRLEGESPCRSFGRSVDLGPDMDGDGSPELVVTDAGCYAFDESGMPETGSGLDSTIEVYRAGTDEVVYRLAADDVRGGVGLGEARFETLPGTVEPILAFHLDGGAGGREDREPRTHVHLGADFTEVRRWGAFDGEVLQLVEPWDFGFDVDGDERPDAVGTMRRVVVDDVPGGLTLYPGLERPVSTPVVYSECARASQKVHSVVPDVDADGYPDVFVSCEEAPPAARFVNGRDGTTIWYADLGDTLVSEPRDLDGDECPDVVFFHRDTGELEVHRCRS